MCSILHIRMFYMRVWAGGFGIVWVWIKKSLLPDFVSQEEAFYVCFVIF